MKLHVCFFLLLTAFACNLRAAGKQLTGQHAPATTPALSPAEAQKRFVVPEGFEVRLFAAEPDVVNPVAMTWDERGRLWVVELIEYPLGAPAGQKPRDRIKILEDTDNDGRADSVKIFADGLNLATGILIGNGGVYVGQAPDLLFLEDTDGDDVADKRTVLLTGFGLHDRHELLNGFAWGPDGWLYMTHGVFTHSKVKIPEATTPGVEMNAAVARFHPRTRKFEIFADGTSNPWGVDFDRYGNAFVSACVIDHLFHMAPGGIYQRQAGTPANPYAYELLPSIVDHKHHMAAYCGIAVYQGHQFPEEYRGRVFMGNIHQNAINHDRLIPNGSSFKAVAEPDFLTTSDGWFRPVVQNVGPDGALWIADWYDKYPCYQNAQADPEGVNRTHGRIWRVVHVGQASRLSGRAGKTTGSRPEKNMDLNKLRIQELLKLLEHPNVWHRRIAQRLLTERLLVENENNRATRLGHSPRIRDVTAALSDGQTLESRLAALWILHNVHSPPMARIVEDREPAIRSWAARVIGERRDGSPIAIASLEKLASDSDPSVRLAVAVACRQLVSRSLTVNTDVNTEAPVGKILAALIKSSADAKDPLIAFMIWMASEPLVAVNPGAGLKWLADNGADTLPLSGILTRKTMRRICDTREPAKLDTAVEFLSFIADRNDALTLAAVEGLIEGQRAKPLVPGADTKPLFAKLTASSNPHLNERVQQLGTLWGDAAAIAKTLTAINDQTLPVTERVKSVQAAAQLKNDAAREAVLKLLGTKLPDPLAIEALRALSAIGGDGVGAQIVKQWQRFSPATRTAAADVLVSRYPWTEALLNGVQEDLISTTDISATARRSIAKYNDPNFDARAEQLLGRFRESDPDKLKLIQEKRKVVLEGKPDLKAGYEVTKRACLICHKLHGEGADVGPDITGVGRANLDMLLANIVDPNQVIGKGYETVEIETKDDRVISGRVIEESDVHVKLISAGPVEHTIARSEIASMRISELSVMPEGLEQMPDDDFRDMVWYVLNPPQDNRPMTPELRRELIGRK